MFGLFDIVKIKKLKGYAEFFELFSLQDTKNLKKLLAIVKIFELDEVQLKCIIRVRQSSEFLDLINANDAIKVIIKETKKLLLCKEPCCDIEIEFYGKELDALINLASKENEALYIVPANNNKDIELRLNDNDHNYITFSLKKYNGEEIKSKIKQIYKLKN